MRVVRFDRPEEFLGAAGPFLGADEALHNLPLGVARACVEDPGRYPGPNYFAAVEDGGAVVGAAIRTHPHHLLFYSPPEAAGAVAEDLDAAGVAPAGVHGIVASADAFAAEWGRRRAVPTRKTRDLRAYRLDAVTPAPAVPGRMRPAAGPDLALVEDWYRAFEEEAHAPVPGSPPEALARRAVTSGRHFFWEAEGVPVCFAGSGRTTPNGAGVGPVYTPPESRRRGYATALVAELSAWLLAGGKRCCFLFTDLANPISNSIYPKVGYRPVADYREFDFRSATPAGDA